MYTDIVQVIRQNSKPLEPIPTGCTSYLTALPSIRAIVFDVYGTLFISESGDRSELNSDDLNLFQQVLTLAGAPSTSEEGPERAGTLFLEEIDASHGQDRASGVQYPEVEIRTIWYKVLEKLYKEGLLSIPADRAVAEACAVYYECLSNPVYPMPGLGSVIKSLKERNAILGIVSNAQFYTPSLFKAFLGKSIEECGFTPDLCIWSYSMGVAKPDRALYHELAEKLSLYSISPGQVLYIGNDMLNDIYPAALEGFHTGLFAGDRRSLRLREKELYSKKVKSDILLTELAQLLDVIDF